MYMSQVSKKEVKKNNFTLKEVKKIARESYYKGRNDETASYLMIPFTGADKQFDSWFKRKYLNGK